MQILTISSIVFVAPLTQSIHAATKVTVTTEAVNSIVALEKLKARLIKVRSAM